MMIQLELFKIEIDSLIKRCQLSQQELAMIREGSEEQEEEFNSERELIENSYWEKVDDFRDDV